MGSWCWWQFGGHCQLVGILLFFNIVSRESQAARQIWGLELTTGGAIGVAIAIRHAVTVLCWGHICNWGASIGLGWGVSLCARWCVVMERINRRGKWGKVCESKFIRAGRYTFSCVEVWAIACQEKRFAPETSNCCYLGYQYQVRVCLYAWDDGKVCSCAQETGSPPSCASVMLASLGCGVRLRNYDSAVLCYK